MNQFLPVMLLKGFILLPNQEVKIELNNELSKEIVELSSNDYNRKVLVITPRSQIEESPDVKDLPEIAVVGHIKSKIELPSGNFRITIRGIERVKINQFLNHNKNKEILEAKYIKLELPKLDTVENKAIVKKIRDMVNKYVALAPQVSNSIINNIKATDDLAIITDMICSFLPLSFSKKLEYVEELNPLYRAKNLLEDISLEIEVLKLDKKIDASLQKSLDDNQKEFILKEKIRLIEEELGVGASDSNIYLEKLASLSLSESAENKIRKEIKKLEYTSDLSPESAMIRNYLDWILNLPWHKYTKENLNIEEISKTLEESHYGLNDIKNRILEYIALKNNNKEVRSPIICLVGPPGVGKTSIAKNIASALNRKFYKISVGGLNDTSELMGHRRTYMGSNPGKIIQGLHKCESNNPVILIDEIDKLTINTKDDPSSALLDILDKEQNTEFIDNYIEEPFDLSHILFILTANNVENIPIPLLDRLEIIYLSSYTDFEKVEIAKRYLIPRILEENKIGNKIISISDEMLEYLINAYTKEAGVRDLSRQLEKLIRKLVLLGKINERTKISKLKLKEYLGIPTYDYTINKNNNYSGEVNALAVQNAGGVLMPVEACLYEGKGEFHITGMLGKVMEESTFVALSYIKSHANYFNLQDFYFNIKDIHLHFLASAIKKDGPSAGIAITTSILSLLLNKKISKNIAFTGEISLNGEILKVGGIKEKLIGAYNNNIKEVYIPASNELDLEEVSKEVLAKLKIHLVSEYKEIYDALF